MRNLNTIWLLMVLVLSNQAYAQSDDAQVWVSRDEAVKVEEIYERNARVDKALADAERCIEIDPSWHKGYLRRGDAQVGLLELDSAIASFQ